MCPPRSSTSTGSDSRTRACASARCSTTMRAKRRCRRRCTPAYTCGRSTSTILTASHLSSPAGPRNSLKTTPRPHRRPRPTADLECPPDANRAMHDGSLSDAQIAAMSAHERRELIGRLERPVSELLPPSELARMRRIRLVLMVGATIGLIPWIAYLSLTLPDKYVAYNWTASWVGFDILLLGFMAV